MSEDDQGATPGPDQPTYGYAPPASPPPGASYPPPPGSYPPPQPPGSYPPPSYPPPPGSYAPPPGPGGYPPAPYGSYPVATGPAPLGVVRGTGMSIFLFFITFGIYGMVWFYCVHNEMKRHSGNGLGGGIALLIYILVGFVSPFLVSSEVGELYKRAGQPAPVSGMTGLWYIPGCFILVGPFIWFIKTNDAINGYWRAVGVR
jgi:hypothetical protein